MINLLYASSNINCYDSPQLPHKFPGEGEGGTMIKRLTIHKDPNPAMGFGFSIKGGRDLGEEALECEFNGFRRQII